MALTCNDSVMTAKCVVSCIMPTADRRRFVPRAIAQFLQQDYANRELIVLDDGAEPVEDLVPDDPRVRYVRARTQIARRRQAQPGVRARARRRHRPLGRRRLDGAVAGEVSGGAPAGGRRGRVRARSACCSTTQRAARRGNTSIPRTRRRGSTAPRSVTRRRSGAGIRFRRSASAKTAGSSGRT